MSGNHPTHIPFASGLLTADLGHQLIYAERGGFQRLTPQRLIVVDALTSHLGEIVSIDELIDLTAANITGEAERYMQRIRVGTYIGGLRKTFNQLIPGAGDIKQGVLQTEYGKGYWLAEYWHDLPVA